VWPRCSATSTRSPVSEMMPSAPRMVARQAHRPVRVLGLPFLPLPYLRVLSARVPTARPVVPIWPEPNPPALRSLTPLPLSSPPSTLPLDQVSAQLRLEQATLQQAVSALRADRDAAQQALFQAQRDVAAAQLDLTQARQQQQVGQPAKRAARKRGACALCALTARQPPCSQPRPSLPRFILPCALISVGISNPSCDIRAISPLLVGPTTFLTCQEMEVRLASLRREADAAERDGAARAAAAVREGRSEETALRQSIAQLKADEDALRQALVQRRREQVGGRQ